MPYTWFDLLVFRLTHRRWNRLVSTSLNQAYARRVIDSHQLHLLAADFDPTQRGNIVQRMRPKYRTTGFQPCLPETHKRQNIAGK